MSRSNPPLGDGLSLVTGGAGFVGRALVEALLARGQSVRALVLPGDSGLDPIHDRPDVGRRLEIVYGDVSSADAVSAAFEGVDDVFHTAALVHAWAPWSRFAAVNIDGARNVAELSLAHSVRRLIAISTTDVFGLPQGDRLVDESAAYRPWGEPYPDSKIEAERWLWRLHRESGLPLTVIYPGWVYGPGDQAFFPGLARAIVDGRMVFWAHGAKLPFVYIDNLVDACLLAASADAAVGQGYIVHDECDGPTLEDLCAAIATRLGAGVPKRHVPYGLAHGAAKLVQAIWRWRGAGTEPPLQSVDVKAFGAQFRLSSAKIRRDLGWAPRVGRDEGMRRALDALVDRWALA